MKTKAILLASAVLGLAAVSSFAQGTIGFVNTSSSLVTTNNGSTTGASTSGFGTKIQLLYQLNTGQSAPSPVLDYTSLGNWEIAQPTAGAVGSPLAGRFGSFTLTTGNDVAQAGNVWLIAVAWNGSATTFANIISGGATYFGISNEWSQGTGGGGPGPVSTTSFTGLVLTPIPEPSTIALAGLGAASLLLFRRRK